MSAICQGPMTNVGTASLSSDGMGAEAVSVGSPSPMTEHATDVPLDSSTADSKAPIHAVIAHAANAPMEDAILSNSTPTMDSGALVPETASFLLMLTTADPVVSTAEGSISRSSMPASSVEPIDSRSETATASLSSLDHNVQAQAFTFR